ncbi:MAG: PAS domain-containing protein, partial [Thermoguttaceae bacterium]
MSNSNSYKPAVVAAIAIAGGLALAWLWIMEFHTASLVLFAGLPCAGSICCCGLLTHLLLRQKRQLQQFQRHIEAMCLCRMLPGSNDNMPALPADHPMSNFAEQIRNTILDYKRRAEDMEHARTAQEVHRLRAVNRAEQIKNIFEGLADPILAIDGYDELVLANHSAEEIFHFETEKIEIRALDKIVRCQKLIDLLASVRQRKMTGSRSEEIELTGENGMPKWYRATACKLAAGNDESPDKSPASEGAVVVLRDIGDHKAVQKRN